MNFKLFMHLTLESKQMCLYGQIPMTVFSYTACISICMYYFMIKNLNKRLKFLMVLLHNVLKQS